MIHYCTKCGNRLDKLMKCKSCTLADINKTVEHLITELRKLMDRITEHK